MTLEPNEYPNASTYIESAVNDDSNHIGEWIDSIDSENNRSYFSDQDDFIWFIFEICLYNKSHRSALKFKEYFKKDKDSMTKSLLLISHYYFEEVGGRYMRGVFNQFCTSFGLSGDFHKLFSNKGE